MVTFNELRITNGKLIIDVSVPSDESYYDNVYLDSIVIDNQDTYVSDGPSSEAIYTYNIPEEENRKHLKLELNFLPLRDMLFVYVRTKGTYAPDTPCGLDNITTMGTVVDMYPFYQQAMNYVNQLAATCTSSQEFADYILKMKALELGVQTGNYPKAIEYFNKFFKGKTAPIPKGGCGCGNV